jgi:hypothetical protein
MDATSLIQGTASVSFAFYTAALLLRSRQGVRSSVASILWTTGFFTMVAHVILAFHFVHDWSHEAALEDTARQTGEVFGIRWGGGVFANYALLVVWGVDVVRWWRGRWSKLTQAFLAFMWINGVIVFGHGPLRWFGAACFAALLIALWRRRRNPPVASV